MQLTSVPPLLGRCFRGFVLPVLEYCFAVWCSAADTNLKLLDSAVNGVCFSAGGMLNCDLAHCRSVAVLRILYKIRYNPMHSLYGTLPVPYVPVTVTRGDLVAHRYTWSHTLAAEPHITADFYSPLSVSLEWS